MPGMRLGSGIGVGGSVDFNSLWGPGGASSPAAAGIPEGSQTIAQAAWGTGAPAPSTGSAGHIASWVGAASLAGLLAIWWVLPK